MTILERVQNIKNNITLNGNYDYELQELESIENDIPVYRHLGTPVWKIEDVKKEIQAIREWIAEELT